MRDGKPLIVTLDLAGHEVRLLNGGPHFKPMRTPMNSVTLNCSLAFISAAVGTAPSHDRVPAEKRKGWITSAVGTISMTQR
jgi:hypothetical protein